MLNFSKREIELGRRLIVHRKLTKKQSEWLRKSLSKRFAKHITNTHLKCDIPILRWEDK